MLIDLARIAQAALDPPSKGSKTKMKAEVSSVKTDIDAGGQDYERWSFGLTSAGERTTGTGMFTLNIPDAPGLTSPVDGAVVSTSGWWSSGTTFQTRRQELHSPEPGTR
jgi:hypothetical protein